MKKFIFIVILLCPAVVNAEMRITAHFIRIIDVEQIVVFYKGNKRRVRLIGVDSPGCYWNEKLFREARRFGRDKKFLLSVCTNGIRYLNRLMKKGDRIYLEFDRVEQDRRGRLLLYVYLKDGSMVNEMIIKAGYSNCALWHPNIRHRDLLKKAYKEALKAGNGLWQ